jgi:hypothetical protein
MPGKHFPYLYGNLTLQQRGKLITSSCAGSLEHSDLVFQDNLRGVANPQMEKVSAVMQQPSPALKDLVLHSNYEMAPVIPGSFLDGSAPCLEYIPARPPLLNYIPLRGLQKLLLTAACLYFPSEYCYFGAHLTQRDGHLPVCDVRVQTQKSPAFIPNPSISP